jgi:thiamine biosynthesis protein ThiS
MTGVDIICNGEPRRVAPGATVADLLAELERPAKQVAVELNQELAPRGRHAELVLQAGDRVEIFTFVGGG